MTSQTQDNIHTKVTQRFLITANTRDKWRHTANDGAINPGRVVPGHVNIVPWVGAGFLRVCIDGETIGWSANNHNFS